MIVYVEIKESIRTKKLFLELRRNYSKVTEYKIHG